MKNTAINDIYDRISKVLKNDQKYSYTKMGDLIIKYANGMDSINQYYEKYPPLLDIIELGAALEYEGSEHPDEIVRQIRYKMSELRNILPDIS